MSKISRISRLVTSRPGRAEPGRLLPGADQNRQNLHLAVARCRQLITAAKNLRKFPGELWTAEAKKWPAYRLQVDRTLLRCQEVGLREEDLGGLLPWIETLDAEWSSASELRDRAAAAALEAGHVASDAQVVPRRLLCGPELDEAIRAALKGVIQDHKTKREHNLTGKEQVTRAMRVLKGWGIEAPRSLRAQVERIADAEFKQFRNPVGETLKRRRPQT
jgi:hypothetical protein